MDIPYKKDDPHISVPKIGLHDFYPKDPKQALEIERLSQLIFTPMDEAVAEIQRRRTDPVLIEKVNTYLNGDVPDYFNQQSPVFYLQRFVATPNFELLHVAETTKEYNLPLLVGQDFKSKFSANNELKLPLGKLPVIKGLSHNADEIVEYFTVIDFNASNGRPLEKVTTKFGTSLIDFHHSLLKELSLPNVSVVDETAWIDRNYRNDIFEQYKRVWALLCVHGIMLESYTASDYPFFMHVVYPTFKQIEEELGITPLVVEHISPKIEHSRNWNSYPSYFYQQIKRKFNELG